MQTALIMECGLLTNFFGMSLNVPNVRLMKCSVKYMFFIRSRFSVELAKYAIDRCSERFMQTFI